MAACVKCVAGKYQAEPGQLGCDDCGKGTYCEAGANAETRCKAGYYNPNERATSEGACKECEPGHACPIGSRAMVKCQPGSFNNQSAEASCRKCAAGTFQKAKGELACEPCELGNYCTKGASSGTPCEAGRFGNRTGLTNLHECHFCEPGHSCLIGAKESTPCTPGSVAPKARYLEVIARILLPSNISTCELCKPGKFQDEDTQEECNECLPGGYCLAGAAAVTPCPAGYYNPDKGAANYTDLNSTRPQCKKCDEGHACPAGTTEQVPCEPGFYTDGSQATLAERFVCNKCEKGKFQSKSGQTACKVCELGGYCTGGLGLGLTLTLA